MKFISAGLSMVTDLISIFGFEHDSLVEFDLDVAIKVRIFLHENQECDQLRKSLAVPASAGRVANEILSRFRNTRIGLNGTITAIFRQ